MRFLVIGAVGDESLHDEWVSAAPDFDLCLIYYGSDRDVAVAYSGQATYFQWARGPKYHLLYDWITANEDLVRTYEYVWLPDNDVSISTADINALFRLADQFTLLLCQPAMTGYVSHVITEPQAGSLLRYTNFVEVLAPLMQVDALMKLKRGFRINHSGWGYDYLWPYRLGYPADRIAIVDKIVMRHTKPVGTDYSRFPRHPLEDARRILRRHGRRMRLERTVYSTVPDES